MTTWKYSSGTRNGRPVFAATLGDIYIECAGTTNEEAAAKLSAVLKEISAALIKLQDRPTVIPTVEKLTINL